MVHPENIDSEHSNSQLDASSGRYHHNLGRLPTNVKSNPKSYTEQARFKPATRNFKPGHWGQNRPVPDCPKKFTHNMNDRCGARLT